MTLTEMRDVIDAAIAGKNIQEQPIGTQHPNDWFPWTKSKPFNFEFFRYRIKPEPREFLICGGVVFVNEYDAKNFQREKPERRIIKVREVLPDE